MKIKLLILILFLNSNCVHYEIHDENNFKLSVPENQRLSLKKIGLLGFETLIEVNNHDFDSYSQNLGSFTEKINSEDYLKIIKFVNQKDKEILKDDNDYFKSVEQKDKTRISLIDKILSGKTDEFLDFKKNEVKLDSKNKKANVKDENLRNFLSDYLGFYKHLGLKSAKDILLIDKSGKISLKNSDAEYWVIGNHQMSGNPFGIEGLFLILTLGILPVWSEVELESNFSVYDKNLSLIKKYSIKRTYKKFQGLFYLGSKFNTNDGNNASGENLHFLYEPTVKEFSKLLAEDLK